METHLKPDLKEMTGWGGVGGRLQLRRTRGRWAAPPGSRAPLPFQKGCEIYQTNPQGAQLNLSLR